MTETFRFADLLKMANKPGILIVLFALLSLFAAGNGQQSMLNSSFLLAWCV